MEKTTKIGKFTNQQFSVKSIFIKFFTSIQRAIIVKI